MPEVSLSEWKAFVDDRAHLHLLQTAEWGELKAGFGWQVIRLMTDNAGAQVLFKPLPLGFSVAYIPKPSFHPESETCGRLLQELVGLCRDHRAVFLKIEPDEWEAAEPQLWQPAASDHSGALRLRRSDFNIQPPRTILVDLGGTEEQILGRMKQKCRYNIRLAEKKGIIVRPWADLGGFHDLMKITGGRDGFGVHSAEYYQRAYELFYPAGKCELLVAEFEGRAVAALMVFRQGRRAWYLYGASGDAERNRMPAYLLQWEAMRWAKRNGCREYDLWGVPDENEQTLEANFETRDDGLWGVYRFKRGFGGQLERAAQAVDIVFSPVLYELYRRRMAGREAG